MPKAMPRGFFDWFDRRLEALGLNDFRASKKAGLSPSVISKARSGVQPIGYAAALKLARALEISPEEILERAGYFPKRTDISSLSPDLAALVQELNEVDEASRAEFIEVMRRLAKRMPRKPK